MAATVGPQVHMKCAIWDRALIHSHLNAFSAASIMFLFLALLSRNPLMPRRLNAWCNDCPAKPLQPTSTPTMSPTFLYQLEIFFPFTLMGLHWSFQRTVSCNMTLEQSDVKTKSGLYVVLRVSETSTASLEMRLAAQLRPLGFTWALSPSLTKAMLCHVGGWWLLCWIPMQMVSATAFITWSFMALVIFRLNFNHVYSVFTNKPHMETILCNGNTKTLNM